MQMTAKPEIILRRATIDDSAAIARAVTMAFGEDMTRRLCGDRGVEIFERIVRMDNTQYSYRNTIVCTVNGVVAGAICGYDGARLHELRQPALDILREECGTVIQVTDETGPGEFSTLSVSCPRCAAMASAHGFWSACVTKPSMRDTDV